MLYSGNKLHPTQKPVAALKPLIEAFTQQGDVVLDPFCGSGSTLLVANILNRKYFGIELDAQYHAGANRRLHPDGLRACQGFYSRSWGRRQGPCRQSAVRYDLQQSSSARSVALTPALRRFYCHSSFETSSSLQPENQCRPMPEDLIRTSAVTHPATAEAPHETAI